jgi:hypothetical protein
MPTVSPYCLVQMDYEGHRNKTIAPGVVIEIQKQYFDNGFNKRKVNCDRGWIRSIPKAKEIAECPVTVKEGSYVFFHFHTLKPENRVVIDGESFYKVHYSNIFLELSEDNVITPLNKFIFNEIMFTETKTSLFLFNPTAPEPLLNKSRVAFKPPYVESVEIGEVVYHKKNTNYDIELPDGRVYYRVREQEIIAKA